MGRDPVGGRDPRGFFSYNKICFARLDQRHRRGSPLVGRDPTGGRDPRGFFFFQQNQFRPSRRADPLVGRDPTGGGRDPRIFFSTKSVSPVSTADIGGVPNGWVVAPLWGRDPPRDRSNLRRPCFVPLYMEWKRCGTFDCRLDCHYFFFKRLISLLLFFFGLSLDGNGIGSRTFWVVLSLFNGGSVPSFYRVFTEFLPSFFYRVSGGGRRRRCHVGAAAETEEEETKQKTKTRHRVLVFCVFFCVFFCRVAERSTNGRRRISGRIKEKNRRPTNGHPMKY